MKKAYQEMKVEDHMLEEKFKEYKSDKALEPRNFKKTPLSTNTPTMSENSTKPVNNQREVFLNLDKKGLLPPPKIQ